MSDVVLERVQRALRGVVAGGERSRVVAETLAGVIDASRASGGVILALVDGQPTVVGRSGADAEAAAEAGRAALLSGRLTRRRFGGDPLLAVGQPVRAGARVVGALAVAGPSRTLDPTSLPVFADLATLALACRPGGGDIATPSRSSADMLVAVATVAAQIDRPAVLVRTLAAAEELFGATAGCCVMIEGDGARGRPERAVVAHQVGLDRERLRQVTATAEFVNLFRATDAQVLAPEHPVTGWLGHGGDSAVVLPLTAEGRSVGHLLLLLPDAPDGATAALLAAFAAHVALALRAATVQRRLIEHEEALVAVVHSVPEPVLVVDHEGRFVTVNGAAAEVFGLAGPFEVGQPLAGRLGDNALEDLLSADADTSTEVVAGHPGRLYRASTRRLLSSERRLLGRVLVLEDVSREREVDQVKSDFVAVIGHELRTPLTVVQGYASTLRRRWNNLSDDLRATAFENLEQNADRLERLIEDLLFVSGIADSSPPLELGPENLGPLLDQCAGGRIVVRHAAEPLTLALDRTKLEQVLRHLLDNALKYSSNSVLLEAVPVAGAIEISVTDTGPGIFSGDLPLLFERFHQLDGSSTRAHGGTGIGLYICRRLVEMMGGRIWCESRLGVGSRFAFTLPTSIESPPLGLPDRVTAGQTWGDGAPAAPADRIRASGGASPRS
jgi:signal transduction histidine kinase